MPTKTATSENFETLVLASDRPILVDFWAEWCGPCKALAPTLEDLSDHYAGEVEIVKVDIVANEALRDRYQVRGIPLLVMFKDGKEKARLTGVVSRTRLDAFIDANR